MVADGDGERHTLELHAKVTPAAVFPPVASLEVPQTVLLGFLCCGTVGHLEETSHQLILFLRLKLRLSPFFRLPPGFIGGGVPPPHTHTRNPHPPSPPPVFEAASSYIMVLPRRISSSFLPLPPFLPPFLPLLLPQLRGRRRRRKVIPVNSSTL